MWGYQEANMKNIFFIVLFSLLMAFLVWNLFFGYNFRGEKRAFPPSKNFPSLQEKR